MLENLKELWNRKMTVISLEVDVLATIPQKIGKGTGRLENKKTRRDYPDFSITKISQNTEKSYGDLRRLAVTFQFIC